MLAGLYFSLNKPVDRGHFSLFCQNENRQQVDFKISFTDVIKGNPLPDSTNELLGQCATQLELIGQNLPELLRQTASALNDSEFMQQLLDINQRIVRLSENN